MGSFVVLHNYVTCEALLIGQFEFAANSAAQLSLDENEGDSWICEEQALNWLSTSKKEVFFREMVNIHGNFLRICQEILMSELTRLIFWRYCSSDYF